MVRSGTLTLGAIVMLGGATGARAGNSKEFFHATQAAACFPFCGPFLSAHSSELGRLAGALLSEAFGRNSNGVVPVNGVESQAAKPIGAYSSISVYVFGNGE